MFFVAKLLKEFLKRIKKMKHRLPTYCLFCTSYDLYSPICISLNKAKHNFIYRIMILIDDNSWYLNIGWKGHRQITNFSDYNLSHRFLNNKKKFLLDEGSFRLTITNYIHTFKSLNNKHKNYEKWHPISASFCLSQ